MRVARRKVLRAGAVAAAASRRATRSTPPRPTRPIHPAARSSAIDAGGGYQRFSDHSVEIRAGRLAGGGGLAASDESQLDLLANEDSEVLVFDLS